MTAEEPRTSKGFFSGLAASFRKLTTAIFRGKSTAPSKNGLKLGVYQPTPSAKPVQLISEFYHIDKPGEYKYGDFPIRKNTNIGVFCFHFEFDQIPYEGHCHAVMIKTDQFTTPEELQLLIDVSESVFESSFTITPLRKTPHNSPQDFGATDDEPDFTGPKNKIKKIIFDEFTNVTDRKVLLLTNSLLNRGNERITRLSSLPVGDLHTLTPYQKQLVIVPIISIVLADIVSFKIIRNIILPRKKIIFYKFKFFIFFCYRLTLDWTILGVFLEKIFLLLLVIC